MLLLVGRQMIAEWMTLSGYFMWKSVFGQNFLNQSVEFPKIIQALWFCGVLCIVRSVSSLGRHAQLTRCFSVVPSYLLVYLTIVRCCYVSFITLTNAQTSAPAFYFRLSRYLVSGPKFTRETSKLIKADEINTVHNLTLFTLTAVYRYFSTCFSRRA